MAFRDVKILAPLKLVKYAFMSIIVRQKRKEIKDVDIIADFDEIVKMIVEGKKSVARFGDGEMRIAIGVDPDGFQKVDADLSKKLQEVIANDEDNLLVGINIALKNYKATTFKGKYFFAWFIWKFLDKISPLLSRKKAYIDSAYSRIYIGKKDHSDCRRKFDVMKTIWEGRDVLIVEGEYSRLGVNNDLLDNAKNVKRVLAPAENAFDVYDEILRTVKNEATKGCLIMVALGASATVLASDLCKIGYQAIDVGHLDLEYEWFLRSANGAVAIPGKYSNEAGESGKMVEDVKLDSGYEKSIIARVGLKG